MDATSLCSIPLIDFSPFLVDDDEEEEEENKARRREERRAVARQIDEVNRTHGFLALINFGITEGERREAFAHALELFDLPDEYKRKALPRIDPTSYVGYAPIRSERLNASRPPEMKEAYNLRFPPAWENRYEGCPRVARGDEPVASDPFERFWENVWLPKFRFLARRFAVACAVALRLDDEDFFARTLERFDLCTVRMLHYPPCDWDETTASHVHDPSSIQTALRIGEHTDFGKQKNTQSWRY